ncbi:bifunctional aspartate kinase/homoserine dehydrogenase I [Mergibacter septicus]|uniref:bifunctional aspartate kinase/homoserine dehydrogenase I n=1 Tax=Mergibacter septicus TaxID=221402 RepID=UPI001C795E38|nr:bifunctional aspartate kinase/homoserine dehydrogenase I [Mergibacter septicus]QDJ13756.1 bifunctional aspartate kinase/homoserine dehydrogenase I [Mergibacter septicus]
MRVLKFGGTSLANPQRFLQAASLIEQAHRQDQAAAVLSAPAKITNYLVSLVEKTNKDQDFQQDLSEAKQIFHTILDGLHQQNNAFNLADSKTLIDAEFAQIQQCLSQYSAQNPCPDNINATIISRGEKLSIAIMQAWFEANNFSVTVINPVEKLLAYGDYLESSVDIERSTQKINPSSIPHSDIVLMAGFTAGNECGELVVLGRNGSDYSAAVLAACLKANCCEIWTDVDGVYTCDPRIVPDAHLLQAMSYQEAMELSYFGAKVIHPRTIAPIAQCQIPCVIKNTANPAAAGTLIDGKIHSETLQVKGITHLNEVAMFSIAGPAMQGTIGMAAKVFDTMSKAGISVILITQSSSEYSISFCVPQKLASKAEQALQHTFAQELSSGALEQIEILDNLSIISVVGDGMKQAKGIAAKFLSALAKANVNIIAIAQGSSERSISVVIPQQRAIEGVKSTHRALFNSQRSIRIFLVGAGGVGGELIDQICRQQTFLAEKNIAIRVCAIANSRQLLLDPEGLDLTNWREKLAHTKQAFQLDKLLNAVKDQHVVNPVFVDCTSSQQIADHYVDFLQAGFHVVTPNKKANTSDIAYYRQLRQAAQQNQRRFMYDTNVGAGLPVIENLQNLLAAGDEVEIFNGILSGSLSYIFGELENGTPLSEVTRLAREKGFTEPDPRDDLSGQDVARKLLILAREIGLELELDDIEVEAVLPPHFAEGKSTAEFMQMLPELDQAFAERVNNAKQQGKVLRYVGQIKHGKCKVAILEVDSDDPLYKVKNGENALAFYTRYYSPIPLLLRGYGAGNDVTAAGIFADILRILRK